MSNNFFENELRGALKSDMAAGHVVEIGESTKFFDVLTKNFPARGSKIDWTQVPGSLERFEEQAAKQPSAFIEFFDDVLAKFALTGDVIYVGDSATEFALQGSILFMRKILPELIEIPQHHYFIGSEYSWCLSLTTEGGMGFGFSKGWRSQI